MDGQERVRQHQNRGRRPRAVRYRPCAGELGSEWEWNATTRLYTDFSPSAEGTWEVSVEYLRKVSVEGGATVTLSVFTKDAFNGIRKRTLEELSSSEQGTTTRGTSIYLDSDTTYDIGFEIRLEGSAGGLAAFGDAFNDPGWNQTRRRANVWDFKVRKR